MAGDSLASVVTVALEDALGRTVTTATNVVTLAIGTNPAGGTLSGTVSVAAVKGIATFTDLHVDKDGAGYTLTASASGLAAATSAAFDITPAATQLAFAIQPGHTVAGASITPAVQVTVTDSSGKTATAFAGSVTVAIGVNPGGGTLSGTTTSNAVNGIATFGDLSIQRAATGYTLTAASGTLKGATSAAFAVAPAEPAAVAFVAQPGTTTAGAMISPAVGVAIKDAFGNTVTSATTAVTVAIGVNPGGGTLSGTTTLNAAGGVATFVDLSIQKAGSGYTLRASADTSWAATSAPFAITAAAPARLAFLVPPTVAEVARAIAPAVQVAIRDSFANQVTGATNAVTMALGANPGGATLAGSLTAAAVNGVATFSNLSLDKLGSGYTLAAAAGTLSGATSPPFSVINANVIAFEWEDSIGGQRGIATIDDNGLGVTRLTTFGYLPTWSPDGMKIAFLTDVIASVGVMNANGSGVVIATLGGNAAGWVRRVTWSPDGTKLGVLADSGVFVMNADGTGLVNIVHADSGTAVTGIAWKPDMTRIAFGGSYSYSSGLFVVAPDGSSLTRILPGSFYVDPTAWSPDGSHLAFECGGDLCVVKADGTGLVGLTTGVQPRWKPDGTRILFVGGQRALMLINPDGSGLATLVQSGTASLAEPSWSPDGQRIAYVAQGGCTGWSSWSSSFGCMSYAPDTLLVVNADGTGSHTVYPAGAEEVWRP